MFVFSAVSGAIVSCCFIFVANPSLYLVAAWMTIISNALFGLSFVFYNSYLPLLVEDHEEVKSAPNHLKSHVRDEISNFMSTVGFMAGFAGSVIIVIIALGVAVGLGASGSENFLSVRVTILLGGLWWALWSIWTILKLKHHPGAPLPEGEWLLTKGWKATAGTLAAAKKFPETFKFLVAYFLYSDSYSTCASVGILIFQDMMCMGAVLQTIIILEVLVIAFIGNYLALKIQQAYLLSPKTMILGSLSCYIFMEVWGIIGLIPGSPIGLKKTWEAFAFAFIHGMNIGAVQSYSRTMFADLLIPGKEAEFFALYEITDKGSSWLGPMVVGSLYDLTKNYNMGFTYLLAMTLLPAMLLASVDFEKGRAEVRKIGQGEEGSVEMSATPVVAVSSGIGKSQETGPTTTTYTGHGTGGYHDGSPVIATTSASMQASWPLLQYGGAMGHPGNLQPLQPFAAPGQPIQTTQPVAAHWVARH